MKLVPYKLDYALDLKKPKVLRLFTANAYVNSTSELVMGRGAAQQVRIFYGVKMARYFGNKILFEATHLGTYGLIIEPEAQIGAFQVKRHFRDPAEISLIATSVMMLLSWVRDPQYQDWEVHMNYPGIGFGGLSKKEVEPWINRFPDNVFVYEYVEPSKKS